MRPEPRDLPRLLEDRLRPSFREAYGALLGRATELNVALTHIRLSTLDFSREELAGVRSIRLLLSEVSAAALDAEAYAVLHRAADAENLRRLLTLLESGVIEVRSAPLGGWAPDFSIFKAGGSSFALLVGPHRFESTALGDGPEVASLHGAGDASRMATRFDELWRRSHDITPAISSVMTRAEARAGPDPGPDRRPGKDRRALPLAP